MDSFMGEGDFRGTAKSAIAENYVMNEIVCQGKQPYYWKSGNTAKLDFIFERNGDVVPVEVKAAANTQAKSYRLFCRKYGPKTGYKVSLKNIAENTVEATKTISLPLVLLWNLDFYT